LQQELFFSALCVRKELISWIRATPHSVINYFDWLNNIQVSSLYLVEYPLAWITVQKSSVGLYRYWFLPILIFTLHTLP